MNSTRSFKCKMLGIILLIYSLMTGNDNHTYDICTSVEGLSQIFRQIRQCIRNVIDKICM